MAETGVSLKLLIDRKKNKVLFAEADKDFVDFLFYILALALGTVTGLLAERDMEGGLQNLYKSIEKLSHSYLQPDLNKDTLLKPKLAISGAEVPLLLSNVEFSTSTAKIYRCNNTCTTNNFRHGYGYPTSSTTINEDCVKYVAKDPKTICPSCKNSMVIEATYVDPPSTNIIKASGGGYVKEVVTYMVMDNLEVMPMSTISSITLFNKFNITEIGTLEEKVLNFGMEEVLKLLKTSLQSKTVLTDVFLSNPSEFIRIVKLE